MAPPSEPVTAAIGDSFASGSVCYIVAINGGTCVTAVPSNGLCESGFQKNLETQFWSVEYEGEVADKVAFRNVESGKYMTTTGPRGYNRVKLADNESEKTWWISQRGRAPGSYWFKAEEHPDAYLCNQVASHAEHAQTYVWPMEEGWTHALCWYLVPPKDYDGNTGKLGGARGKSANGTAEKSGGADSGRLKAENESQKAELDTLKAELEKAKAQKTSDPSVSGQDQAKMRKALEEKQKEIEALKLQTQEAEKKLSERSDGGAKSSKAGGYDPANEANAELAKIRKENEKLKSDLEILKAMRENERLRAEVEALQSDGREAKRNGVAANTSSKREAAGTSQPTAKLSGVRASQAGPNGAVPSKTGRPTPQLNGAVDITNGMGIIDHRFSGHGTTCTTKGPHYFRTKVRKSDGKVIKVLEKGEYASPARAASSVGKDGAS